MMETIVLYACWFLWLKPSTFSQRLEIKYSVFEGFIEKNGLSGSTCYGAKNDNS